MKTLLFFLVLSFGLSNGYSQSDKTLLVAACCEEGRGCTGSTYCTACKNCTGCKHCAKNGGRCGVCSSYTKKRSVSKTASNPKVLYNKGDLLYVKSETLNLRAGASTKHKVIEKLTQSQQVELLEVKGSWLKVKVKASKNIGYVYAKYLKRNT